MKKIVCFGEVLWDELPSGSKVGGAPLNVAIRLGALGNESCIVSSIGKDKKGNLLLEKIAPYPINKEFIQKHDTLATSVVKVEVDEKGIATYDIVFPRAWDEIKNSKETAAVIKQADAFVYGSLVARNSVSRLTLLSYLEEAKYKIFDANLRAPHFSIDLLVKLMEKADFIKLNDEELFYICKELGSPFSGLEENIRLVADRTRTQQLCVTLGEKGAVLLINKQFYYNSGYPIKVVDTVGAGDSFLATLISHLLDHTEAQKALNYASAVGAMVAKSQGANPMFADGEIDEFINSF